MNGRKCTYYQERETLYNTAGQLLVKYYIVECETDIYSYCTISRPELVAVMTSIGNDMANSVWEANTKGRSKPAPGTPR